MEQLFRPGLAIQAAISFEPGADLTIRVADSAHLLLERGVDPCTTVLMEFSGYNGLAISLQR